MILHQKKRCVYYGSTPTLDGNHEFPLVKVQALLDCKVHHFEDPGVRTLNNQGQSKTGVCGS